MYNNFQLTKKYFHYFINARNGKGHGIHSPFVFDFVTNVLGNPKRQTPPVAIEQRRSELLQDQRTVTVEDFGAGSRKAQRKERKIADIAASALKPPRYGKLLHRLAAHYKPQNIIELGTSFGITTSYLASASQEARVTTIEGSRQIADVAEETFRRLNLANVQQIVAPFDDVLEDVLNQNLTVGMCYVDGNHCYSPTMKYFHQLITKTNSDSILVFDDIHWSAEMEQAWDEIREHELVQYTIDVFFLGFVFFKSEFRVKQNFVIRF